MIRNRVSVKVATLFLFFGLCIVFKASRILCCPENLLQRKRCIPNSDFQKKIKIHFQRSFLSMATLQAYRCKLQHCLYRPSELSCLSQSFTSILFSFDNHFRYGRTTVLAALLPFALFLKDRAFCVVLNNYAAVYLQSKWIIMFVTVALFRIFSPIQTIISGVLGQRYLQHYIPLDCVKRSRILCGLK